MTSGEGEQGEQLVLLIESIEDYAIFMLSPTGYIRSWNRGAAAIMGYPAEEVIGTHFSRFYGPEDLNQKKPQRELETAAAEGRVEDEGWRIRRDGSRFWANTIITALRDERGEIRGYAKVTRDLTTRREAEERLRESQEIFRLLVNSVEDYAIFMLDPAGNVATWNAGAAKLKGYTPDEIVGRHFSVFYPAEDVQDGKPERELEIAKERGSVEDEGWRLRRDGTRFWANVVITAVVDEQGKLRGFAKVTRDMTERKRTDEMRLALFRQREEASRMKDEFLMTLSHELRTPLTAILGWARLLETIPPGAEEFHEAISEIGRSVQLQAKLIEDVLEISRLVSGDLRLSVETVDLVQLLNASIASVRESASEKGLTTEISFDPQLGTIEADAARLQKMMRNLLTNAVKFTPEGGHIRVDARRTASDVRITVSDTGEGIAPDFLPQLFQPFRQAENPSTRVHGGLGLGLSIVRYLAHAHGGSVAAESAGKGKGATLTVTLPLRPVSTGATELRAASVFPAGERFNGTGALARRK